MTSAEKALELYRELYGVGAEKVFSAPGRVNLIGEHTDYNGGLVLPVAISERTWIAVGKNSDRDVRVASEFSRTSCSMSLDSSEVPHEAGWSLYPLGVAWLMHQHYGLPHGVNMAISSNVPIGAGLSSSAALESATALSLQYYLDHTLTPLQLAKIGQEAENTIVLAPTGLMDQIASIMSVAHHATMIDFAELNVSHHRLDLDAAGLTLMVVDTGVKHSHSSGQYGKRREECEAARDLLSVSSLSDATLDQVFLAKDLLDSSRFARARHVVTENERVRQAVRALDSGTLESLGPLFYESHQSLRNDFEVSCEELDCAVDEAYEAGALAARMTGGGFGGSAIVISTTENAHLIKSRIMDQFADRGFARPNIFRTDVSGGARQDS